MQLMFQEISDVKDLLLAYVSPRFQLLDPKPTRLNLVITTTE